MRKWKRHLGSTVSIVLGLSTFAAGINQKSSLLVAGPILVIGAFAYRSAKKRYLGEVANSLFRKFLEAIAIIAIVAAILLQKNLKVLIATDPVPNLIIPLCVLIAYAIIALRKPKGDGVGLLERVD
jgi:hypothetical protein